MYLEDYHLYYKDYLKSIELIQDDEKKTTSGKKDKDDDEGKDKKDGFKKKRGKEIKGEEKKDPDQGKEKVCKIRKGGGVKQQTRDGNCDVSTISQGSKPPGSKPRIEITSANLKKSITMFSETALQHLTPTQKRSRKSPIRNLYKVTIREVIKRNMEKDVKVKTKLTNIVPVNSLQRTSFKHSGRQPCKA